MNIQIGFHSIEEKVLSLEKSKDIKKYHIYYSKVGPRVKKILASANKIGLEATLVDEKQLDSYVQNLPDSMKEHRGIVMIYSGEEVQQNNQVEFDDWIKESKNLENATVVILDRVTDPHNVGAILRSCDQFGVDLVIMPERKSANNIEDNEVIARSSAGSSTWVPYSVVTNLVRAAEKLKDAGFWLYGADAGGENCCSTNFAQKSVLIMGSEGTGISKLLEEKCDFIVSIPTCGKIDSLNVSVATGVLLYELYRRKIQ